MEKNDKKCLIEILLFLIEEKKWKSTRQIREYLDRIGVLQGSKESKRRKVYNYLNELEYLGYIIQKDESSHQKKWKVNEKRLQNIISLSDDEKEALYLSLVFIPEEYKNLEYINKLESILKKAGERLEKNKKRIIFNAFQNISDFTRRYFDLDFSLVEKFAEDILKQKKVKIRHKNHTREILPLEIIYYEGLLYLFAKSMDEGYFNTYRLGCLERIISEGKIKEEDFLFIQSRAPHSFTFAQEEPFPFAIELPSYYIRCEKERKNLKKLKLFSTQFDIEVLNNNNVKVYLIGLTSPRFVSHFLTLDVKKIYPPDREIINSLKKNLKDKNTKEILYKYIGKERTKQLEKETLRHFKKLFNQFKKELKEILNQKLNLL